MWVTLRLGVGMIYVGGQLHSTQRAISIGSIACVTAQINSKALSINTTAPTVNTTTTTIGATNGAFDTNTVMNGKTTINKLAAALTPVYSYPISSSSRLGFVTSPSFTWKYTTDATLGTSVILPAGTYTTSVCISVTGTYVPNFLYLDISLYFRVPFIPSFSPFIIASGTYSFTLATSKTVSLLICAANNSVYDTGDWTITRLA